MVVPDLLFDIVVFGALLLALLLDNVFAFSPLLHGAVSLLAVGLATYIAAQEMCDALERRNWWTQESLATTLSIATLGFVYYFRRNDSDLALLGLSVALMMTALMLLISLITSLGSAWNERSGRPLAGLIGTMLGALALGELSGLLVLVLSSGVSVVIKAIILLVGAVAWKLRALFLPPARNQEPEGVSISPEEARSVAAASANFQKGASGYDLSMETPLHPGARRALVPQRGRLLDRLLPVLILSALFFLVLQQTGTPWQPSVPAVASVDTASGAGNDNASDNATTRGQ